MEDLGKIEWISARERFAIPKKLEPEVDWEITKIVGTKIFKQDPRVLKLVVKFKANKPIDSMQPDNFLENPKFVEELKKVLTGNI